MAKVIFYEKPGCANNARQRKLLQAAGHEVETRDLLRHPWTAQTLRPFFGARPVAEWFNRASPRVKTGEVLPEAFEGEAALAAMIADPLLIRRPLIEVGGERVAGFDGLPACLGLDSGDGASAAPEACTQPKPCPAPSPDGCAGGSEG